MYSFFCFGHKNITSSHKNTLEFTKDKEIGKIAHCIIGVNSDFDLNKIKKELNKEKLTITIQIDNIKEQINCIPNKDFNDKREIVIRKSNFNSKRTLGIYADKSSQDLKKEIKQLLKDPNNKIKIILN